MISQELLDILCCPLDKAELRLEENKLICTGTGCGLKFRIDDDIPIMLIEEAELPEGVSKLEDLPAMKIPVHSAKESK